MCSPVDVASSWNLQAQPSAGEFPRSVQRLLLFCRKTHRASKLVSGQIPHVLAAKWWAPFDMDLSHNRPSAFFGGFTAGAFAGFTTGLPHNIVSWVSGASRSLSTRLCYFLNARIVCLCGQGIGTGIASMIVSGLQAN
jgi:hypothetical protein